MKLLILGIDALDPKMLFQNIDDYPNIKKLCHEGVSGDYDAYVYGYGSRDNWVALYTGLSPKQHGTIGNVFTGTGKKPQLEDYDDKQPFWNVLNANGISVGMWKAISTSPTRKINGYMIGGEPDMEIPREGTPIYNRMPLFCDEDKELEKYIEGEIEEPPMPRVPENFGYTWEQLLENPALADKFLKDDYYHEGVEYFARQCEFYRKNIVAMQKNKPVDVLFYYTDIIDFILHFQCHDDKLLEIKKSFAHLDKFVGDLMDELSPETVILMSDHGISTWADYFPNTPLEIQKEAFGLARNSIWLKNGQIVSRARNNAFISSAHGIKGSFIAAGKNIKRDSKIKEMRTVDFYPTLLEFFNIPVPEGRQGYVLDIFEKGAYVNEKKVLKTDSIRREKIGIIQNIEVSEFNRAVNDVFLEHRFAEITVIGEEKYGAIFQGDTRVDAFIPLKDNKLDFKQLGCFDKVYLCYRNMATKKDRLIEIAKNN